MLKMKPYDLQVNHSEFPEDDVIDEWFASREAPLLNVLVGLPKCGKTSFIEKYGLQGFGSTCFSEKKNSMDITREINIIGGIWYEEDLQESINNNESIIWDSENLTRRERKDILNKFPDKYRKVAIVWELSDSELCLRGCNLSEIEEKGKRYERPTEIEGFDEFIYILA